MEITKQEEETKGRLVAKTGDQEMGEMTYSLANDGQLMIVDHTGVGESYKGQGVGQKLFFELIKMARSEAKKVMPLCPFTRSMFERHTDMWDVLRNNSL